MSTPRILMTGVGLPPLFRVDAAVDAGGAGVVPQERMDAPSPGVTRPRRCPSLALRHALVLEFVKRQVFRLTLDRDPAARVDDPGHRQIARNVDGVVPV